MRRPPPVFHPFLFAAFPVLFLFQHNRSEVTWAEVWTPLGLALAGAAGVLALALLSFRGNGRKAALVGTTAVVLFFSFGHVREALVDVSLARTRNLLALWGLVAVAAVVLIARASRGIPIVTKLLNAAGAGLVVTALAGVGFGGTLIPITGSREVRGRESDVVLQAPEKPRDIYYLVFDRYPSNHTFEEVFDFDNTPFLDALRERGFYVAADARSNYVNTALSLASSLHGDYLDDVLADAPGNHWGPTRDMIRDHMVGRALKRIGYRYVHSGSWWESTRTSRIADVVYEPATLSEFSRVLWDTTLLRVIGERGGGEGAAGRRQEHRRNALFQFGTLRRTARFEGPDFVFAHLLLPHRPYVFDRSGDVVSNSKEKRWGIKRAFVEQTLWTNGQILRLVDVLLDRPPDERPIIVLTADEGPYPARWQRLRYAERTGVADKTAGELRLKYQILNAFYLPGVKPEEAGLHPAISPVNQFRVVFNSYFGTDLDLLDDRSYIFLDANRRFDFTEVTHDFDADGGTGPVPEPA